MFLVIFFVFLFSLKFCIALSLANNRIIMKEGTDGDNDYFLNRREKEEEGNNFKIIRLLDIYMEVSFFLKKKKS